MTTLKLCLAIVILAVSVVLGQHFAHPSSSVAFGLPSSAELKDETPWLLLIVEGVLLVAGVVFGFMYQRLVALRSASTDQVDIPAEFRRMLRATEFFTGLVAAPVIFGVVVAASKGAPALAAFILAFQNGFFWQSVMPQRPPAHP